MSSDEGMVGGRAVRRRSLIGGALGGLAALGLTSCGQLPGGSRVVTLYQSKPEAIPYFSELLGQFNQAHEARAVHDSSSRLSAGFARNSPPDLGCLNYNYEMARFQERGALADLSGLAAADAVAPEVAELVDQYPTYPGRTSVIPYSMMAASVLYNRDLFDQHDLEVPTTFSELIEVCETFTAAGVTPIISTYGDAWTVSQGLADYSIGGSIDVAEFFARLREQGADVTPDSEVSFSQVLAEPLQQMLQLAAYSNANAPSLGYGDGNLAFARGQGAMYLQGPWALGEIAKTDAGLDIGAFPLPMTEDPADLRVRVNLDLALWVPEAAGEPEAARELAEFLLQPEIQDTYNSAQLGFGTRVDAPDVTDDRLLEMQPYVDRAAFYQGTSTAVPGLIPFENYMQGLVLGAPLADTLATLDADWARLARRE